MRPSPGSKKKSKLSVRARAFLLLLGVLFPLGVIEVTACLVPTLIPLEIKSVFQNEENQPLKGLIPDPELGYKYAPNLVNFQVPFEGNEGRLTYPVSTLPLGYKEIGFRDDGLNKPPFAVVIGDSYAGCASVNQANCWVELLEQSSHKDFANMGVVGYGPQQELRMLTYYGLPLQPKLVLWVFFANDLNDAWRFDQFGSGAAREGKFWQNPLKAWLARHSTVYPLFSFFWYNRYLFYNLATIDNKIGPPNSNLVWWLTYTDLTVPVVNQGYTLTQEAIVTASRQTQARGARFVVLILPFREQVYAAAIQPGLDNLNNNLVNFCRQQFIPVIDLTPALRKKAAAEPDPIYYLKDIHLNARGNQIVAELLDQELK